MKIPLSVRAQGDNLKLKSSRKHLFTPVAGKQDGFAPTLRASVALVKFGPRCTCESLKKKSRTTPSVSAAFMYLYCAGDTKVTQI